MTLTEFLLERIAEDEAEVKAVPGPKWARAIERKGSPGHYRGIEAELVTLPPSEWPPSVTEVGPELARTQSHAVADHIARHDPARVLAECEAKRRIVAAHRSQVEGDDENAWIVRSDVLLEALAAVYADHPDYPLERENRPPAEADGR